MGYAGGITGGLYAGGISWRNPVEAMMGQCGIAAAMLEEMPVELLVGLPLGLWERPRRETPQAGRRALSTMRDSKLEQRKRRAVQKMNLDIDTFTYSCSTTLHR